MSADWGIRLIICLERDDFSSNRHPALSFCLSMIFSENRYPPSDQVRGHAFPDHALATAKNKNMASNAAVPKTRGANSMIIPWAVLSCEAERCARGCSKLLDALVGCLGPPLARLVFCRTARCDVQDVDRAQRCQNPL